MNCPFYGWAVVVPRTMQPPRGMLWMGTHGNQCGAVIDAHSPCVMEGAGHVPDWKTCPLLAEAQGREG